MNKFFKYIFLFSISFVIYAFISFSYLEHRSDLFVKNLENSVLENDPSLISEYSPLEFTENEMKDLSQKEAQIIDHIAYEFETFKRNVSNIKNIEIKKISSSFDNNFIAIERTDCYKLKFNKLDNTEMFICTSQNITNMYVFYLV